MMPVQTFKDLLFLVKRCKLCIVKIICTLANFKFKTLQNPLNIYQYIMCAAQVFFNIVELPKELRGSKYWYNIQFKDNVVIGI